MVEIDESKNFILDLEQMALYMTLDGETLPSLQKNMQDLLYFMIKYESFKFDDNEKTNNGLRRMKRYKDQIRKILSMIIMQLLIYYDFQIGDIKEIEQEIRLQLTQEKNNV